MKEAAKQFAKGHQDEIAYAQLDQAEPLTGETAGNSDEKYIPPFPYWDETINESGMDGLRESGMDGLVSPLMNQAEAATDTEAVGYPRGLFPLPNFSDQSANVDEHFYSLLLIPHSYSFLSISTNFYQFLTISVNIYFQNVLKSQPWMCSNC